MEGVNFSKRVVDVLTNFVSSWPGMKIGQHRLATVANADGEAPPLIWVFNSAHEFPALAAALGPDQPLIALRSLNAAVRIDRLITWDERLLARLYADEIMGFLEKRPCYVGGNCQGATIAGELARILLLSGSEVLGFTAMEWADLTPLPLHSTLLYGATSEQHNPFLRDVDPLPLWERIYAQHCVGVLPARHGEYFHPDNIPALASHLRTALSVKSLSRGASQPAAALSDLPQRVAANEKFTVQLAQPSTLGPQEDVVCLWDRHVTSLPHRKVASADRVPVAPSQFTVTAPHLAGTWTLQMFRCRAGQGPLAWTEETQRYHRVEVVEPAGPE